MADDPQEGGGEGQPDGGLDDRVRKLETGQDALAGKIDHLIGMLGGGGEGGDGGAHTGEATGASVAEEMRRQFAERDRQAADDAHRSATSDRIGALETKLSEMAETRPGPLPRRVEKIMGWT